VRAQHLRRALPVLAKRAGVLYPSQLSRITERVFEDFLEDPDIEVSEETITIEENDDVEE